MNEKENIIHKIKSEINSAIDDFDQISDFNSSAWSDKEHQAYIKGLEKALEIADSEGK
jgi:hypothetical protein